MVNTANNPPKSMLDQNLPFFCIIALLAAVVYMPFEIGRLCAFIITLIIYIVRRYDPRLLIGTGVYILLLSAGAFALRGKESADFISTHAFYFLAIGVIGMLIDFVRSK